LLEVVVEVVVVEVVAPAALFIIRHTPLHQEIHIILQLVAVASAALGQIMEQLDPIVLLTQSQLMVAVPDLIQLLAALADQAAAAVMD
jgi:hypothetical protein